MFTKKQLLTFLFICCLGWVFGQNYEEMIAKGTYSVAEIQKVAYAYFDQVGTGRGTGHKQFKRWEYNALRKMDENGYLRNPYEEYEELQRFQRAYRQKTAGRRIQVGSNGNWEQLGPTYWNATSGWNPGVGRITSIAVDENNYNHIIVGSHTGGVWKTTDKGQSWTPLSDEFSTMDVGALTIDPKNSSTYYWGSTSGNVYKSTDAGSNWIKIGRAGFSTVNKILIHPTNTDILFASIDYSGIYKSTNGGTSWTKVISSMNRGYDVQFKPGNPNTVYASGTGFYRSTDGGNNFTKITTGSGIQMIGVSPATPSRVYVIEAASNKTFAAIYKSTNSGASFTKLNHTDKNYFGYSTTANDDRGQAPRDMAIAVSPTNADEVHIAGILTWRSTNGGTSFSCTSDWTLNGASNKNIGYCHADVDIMMFYGNTLYVGSDGGIFIAENTANVNKNYYKDLTIGMGIRQFYKIGVSQTDPVVISGGSQDNGTSVMKGADPVWYDWLGADGMETFIDWNNSNNLYGTSQYGDLYQSTNGGQTRRSISSPEDKSGSWVTPFEQDPQEPSTLYGGYDHVYKSTNSGTSWISISQDFGGNLNELKIAPSNNKIMYASRGKNLYKTTTGNGTWATLSGFGNSSINYIAIHPTDPNRVALATGSSVYVSTDGGISWTDYSKNLPNMSALAVVWQNSQVNGLYVGMDYGIYYIEDGLSDWEPFMTNIPNVQVNELEINYKNQKIYAATYGRGLWVSDLRGVEVLKNDIAITKWVTEPAVNYCQYNVSFTPEVEIKNLGSNLVTSAKIRVQLDGKTQYTYTYTGNLEFGASTTVKLKPIDNITSGNRKLKIFIKRINGVINADEKPENDTKEVSFSITEGQPYEFFLGTDKFPADISWEITQNGTKITSGGDYTKAETNVITQVCLADGCYNFKIYDSFGDGLREGDNGNYYLKNTETEEKMFEMTATNGDYGSEATHDFCTKAIEYDVAVTNLVDVSTDICATEITPKITIQNLGTQKLTGVTLKVLLDGNVIKTVNHTTNLAKDATEDVIIDISLTANINGKLKVVAEKPNGKTDEVGENNESAEKIVSANIGTSVQLTINFGLYPQDISWALNQKSGTLIEEFDHTTNNTSVNQKYTKDFCLVDDCYTFTINDSHGDGLLGNATYTLTNQSTSELLGQEKQVQDWSSETHDFCLGGQVSVDFLADQTTVKQCDEVTFTANVVGTITSYTWDFGNGQTATGIGPHKVTYQTTGSKTVKLTVNGTEVKTKTAYINVNENLLIQPGGSIQLSKGTNPSCANEELSFYVGGSNISQNATYNWKLNGGTIATTNDLTYSQFQNGDKLVTEIITNSSCLTDYKVTTAEYILQRTANVTPTLLIQTPDLPACEGSKITFTTDAEYEGLNPVYEWSINGVSVGTGTTFESTTLANGDVVFCQLTSSEECVTKTTIPSNAITTEINVCTGTLPTEFSAIIAYPNPTENRLNISLGSLAGKTVKWTMYNTYGQIVHIGTQKVTKGFTHSIDMSTMSVGTYFLKIETEVNSTIIKVEKK